MSTSALGCPSLHTMRNLLIISYAMGLTENAVIDPITVHIQMHASVILRAELR